MINRADLKEKANFAFKRNYWPCVAVALIIAFVSGGSSGGSSFSRTLSNRSKTSTNSIINHSSDSDNYTFNIDGEDYDLNIDDDDFSITPNSDPDDDSNHGDNPGPSTAQKTGLFALFGALSIFVLAIIFIAVVAGVAFTAFVTSPLLVGCKRYFAINSFEKPDFGEVGYSFKKGQYMNIVKVMFLKNLFIGLWTLLFIIPGIIKAYEYYMVEYILSEDPTINYKDALEQSRRMMDGYKMDTFVLELSFIGWAILAALTCGILSIFYVNPYIHATKAELFLFLRQKNFPNAAPYYVPSFAGAYGTPNAAMMNQGVPAQGQPQNYGGYNAQPQPGFGAQNPDPYGQAQNASQFGQNPQQNSNNQNAYGMKSDAQSQNSYGQPQDPYGQPQDPYGQPQDPYGQPQDPTSAQPSGTSYDSSSSSSIDPDGYYNQ